MRAAQPFTLAGWLQTAPSAQGVEQFLSLSTTGVDLVEALEAVSRQVHVAPG
ncbi:MAG: hypothetical protein AB1758_16575 [Candidatus Eremiobacterota bacterium]